EEIQSALHEGNRLLGCRCQLPAGPVRPCRIGARQIAPESHEFALGQAGGKPFALVATSRYIPEEDRRIRAGRGQRAAVGRESEGGYSLLRGLEFQALLARGRLPQQDRSARVRGGQGSAIGRESNRVALFPTPSPQPA